MAKSKHTKQPEQSFPLSQGDYKEIDMVRSDIDHWMARISPALKTPDFLQAIAKLRGWLNDWERELNAKFPSDFGSEGESEAAL